MFNSVTNFCKSLHLIFENIKLHNSFIQSSQLKLSNYVFKILKKGCNYVVKLSKIIQRLFWMFFFSKVCLEKRKMNIFYVNETLHKSLMIIKTSDIILLSPLCSGT